MFNPIRVYFLEKKIIEIENNFKKKFFSKRIEKEYTFIELLKIILESRKIEDLAIFKHSMNYEKIKSFTQTNLYEELSTIVNNNDKEIIFKYFYKLIKKKEIDSLFQYFCGYEQKELELLFIEEYIFDYLIRNRDSSNYYIKDNDSVFLHLDNLEFLLFDINENFIFRETKDYVKDIKKLYVKFLIELEKNGYSKLPDYYIFRSISNNYKIV